MKLFKGLVVCVLGVLILASASLAVSSTATKGKRPEPYGGSKPAVGIPTIITTVPQYKAVELFDLFQPWGLGVGALGDYVLANSYGDGMVVGFRNGKTGDVADGLPQLEAGRMWGKYYFGTKYGGVYSLDGNGTVTPLALPYDPDVDVFALDVDHATGAVYYAITDQYTSDVYFLRWVPGWGGEPLFSGHYFTCMGLAIKGNYLYFSIAFSPEGGRIYKTDKRGGGPVILVASGLDYPEDIIFDAQGNLFIAEYGAGCIDMIKAGTTKVKRIAWGIPGPIGLGLDKAGDVFFSVAGTFSVWKLVKR